MLVISDASPINVLVRIGFVDLLPRLFGTIVIPVAVADELSRDATPRVVRDWLAHMPTWIEMRKPVGPSDITIVRHRGEREAIQLALELKADLLLVDELRPRRIAVSLGIAVVGTIGILERAAAQRLIDLDLAFTRLRQTDFYVSEDLLLEAARRHQKRIKATAPPTAPSPLTEPTSGDAPHSA